MPELSNSTRRIQKATYVNVRAADNPQDRKAKELIRRPFEKLNYLRALQITRDELQMLHKTIEKAIFPVLEGLLSPNDSSAHTSLAHIIGSVPLSTLTRVGALVAADRRDRVSKAQDALTALTIEYDRVQERYDQPKVSSSLRSRIRALASNYRWHARKPTTLMPPTGRTVGRIRSRTAHLEEIIRWGILNRVQPALELERINRSLRENATYRSESIPDIITSLIDRANHAENARSAFADLMAIEPIGRLHLERLEMTPIGVEQGELISSIPLAPGESVNVSHREWSTRTEEFDQIVQDAFEGFSEEGVSEKSDLAQSSQSQQRHSTAFTLSGSYSAYGGSIAVGYNSTSDDQQARSESQQASIAMTRKASSRTRQEHKMSFRVNSVVGREEQSVRTITNPSATNANRVDYFQLVRKWRTDLYRYGLRMTYDIVIPSPGTDLLRKLDEIRNLEALIAEQFTVPFQPAEITRDNWQEKAAEFNAEVNPPPEELTSLREDHVLPWQNEGEAKRTGGVVDAIEFRVEPGYRIKDGNLKARCWGHPGYDARFQVFGAPEPTAENDGAVRYDSTLSHLYGLTGDLAVVCAYRWIATGWVNFSLNLELEPELFERWQYETWTTIRNAAEQSYFSRRQLLIEQRDQLLEEIKQWDALTLRRMEREEIMKGVLRWLLGPEFELGPGELEDYFEPITDDSLTEEILPKPDTWDRVMAYGEMIKFLHTAIEWENVLYFTYPYFWDTKQNWTFKRFLRHPDPIHREFLRAGSARVVLTVRPGYELDFARFVELGELGADHPYVTIAQEIQNYASTNYPGIPPANPANANYDSEVAESERGKLMAYWFEYTPTGAIDVAITAQLDTLA
jgi:hypothetical protein